MDNRSLSLIESLPDEILVEIAENNFRASDYIPMGGESCWRFHGLFGAERRFGLKLLQQLPTHVVRGEQSEAEFLLKLFPDLLTSKGTVIDYSGRTIEGTALQIALGAEDVRYHDDEECMAEMIQRHLREQFTNGEEVIAAQIAEQFPEGWEEKEKERAENDLRALKKIFDVISVAQPNDDCEAALQEFRDYLKPKDVIKKGKHFNTQLLVDAFKLYHENYDRFGGWESHKNNLFWCKVIGYVQRFLPACYAQAFCQGIYRIVDSREKLNRNLKFRYGGVSFYPLDSDPRFRLSYDYAAAADAGAPVYGCGVQLLYDFCQAKNINVARIYIYAAAVRQQSREESVHRNVAF